MISDIPTEKILRVMLEINLNHYETWCKVTLKDEQIKEIEEFLQGDNITYNLRDFINDNFRGKK